MNNACMEFVLKSLQGENFDGKRILEIGAYDHNGTVRPAFAGLTPEKYIGIDIQAGPNVDEVCSVYELTERFGKDHFDLVINTELLEHVEDWKKAIDQMKAVTKVGGLLIMTTRSRGFPYHGYPYDFWRYSYEDMQKIFSDSEILFLEKDPIEPGVFIKARKIREESRSLDDISLFCILTGAPKQHLSEEEVSRAKNMPLKELELLWYSPPRRWYRRYIRTPWRPIEKAISRMLKGNSRKAP